MAEKSNYIRSAVDAAQKIHAIAAHCSHFKIGKTGQNLSDIFNSEYKDAYDRIEAIHKTTLKAEVDELEAYLIDHFQAHDKYASECDNKDRGGGEIENSGTYCVYVVVKD
ncbi:MAG: hypothetical protein MUO27_07945 [Sedimentisphaerales bacterium]|nr:hypothetical protein [Sedimentisphaerales bacterium]